MFSALDEPEADEETGEIPTLDMEILGHERHICAVNVRTLEDVDIGALKVRKFDGRSKPGEWTVE
jgi:hypothetical protein